MNSLDPKQTKPGAAQRARRAELPSHPSTLLFVYGTLKRDFPNGQILANAHFAGTAKTRDKFALYIASIPHVVKSEAISQIIGELFIVDAELLNRIDDREGHPHWYCREQIAVEMETGLIVPAWIYFFPRSRGKLVESGEFSLTHLF